MKKVKDWQQLKFLVLGVTYFGGAEVFSFCSHWSCKQSQHKRGKKTPLNAQMLHVQMLKVKEEHWKMENASKEAKMVGASVDSVDSV